MESHSNLSFRLLNTSCPTRLRQLTRQAEIGLFYIVEMLIQLMLPSDKKKRFLIGRQNAHEYPQRQVPLRNLEIP